MEIFQIATAIERSESNDVFYMRSITSDHDVVSGSFYNRFTFSAQSDVYDGDGNELGAASNEVVIERVQDADSLIVRAWFDGSYDPGQLPDLTLRYSNVDTRQNVERVVDNIAVAIGDMLDSLDKQPVSLSDGLAAR